MITKKYKKKFKRLYKRLNRLIHDYDCMARKLLRDKTLCAEYEPFYDCFEFNTLWETEMLLGELIKNN